MDRREQLFLFTPMSQFLTEEVGAPAKLAIKFGHGSLTFIPDLAVSKQSIPIF